MYFRPYLWLTIFSVLGFAMLIALGQWQLERRDWKLDLIGRMEARMTAPTIAIGDHEAALALPVADNEYRHIELAGRFHHRKELHWFTQAGDLGPGYDIITPLELADGSFVLVDRGFVPEKLKEAETRPEGQSQGRVSVTGVLRASVEAGALDAEDDLPQNVWFTRDVAKMAQAAGVAPVAPFLVVQDGQAPEGGWPRPGAARPQLKNDHLQYALTWFGLAGVLVGVYFAYHVSRGRLGWGKKE